MVPFYYARVFPKARVSFYFYGWFHKMLQAFEMFLLIRRYTDAIALLAILQEMNLKYFWSFI